MTSNKCSMLKSERLFMSKTHTKIIHRKKMDINKKQYKKLYA